MSPHDLGWRAINHKARMRYGLRWRKSHPTWPDLVETLIYWIAAIGIIAGLMLIWSALDARDARITAEIQGDKASRQFADFLNGGVLTNPEQTLAIKCAYLVEAVK